MVLVSRSKHDFERINMMMTKILDQIAEEKQAHTNQTSLFVVCEKLSPTARVALTAGSQQDDHNMLYYFSLGNDLNDRRINFNFYTAEVLSILKEKNNFFILLKN